RAAAVAAAVLGHASAATLTLGPRPDELDRRGDDLGLVALHVLLVRPVPRLDAALDVHLAALLQPVLREVRQLAERDDAVPLRLLLAVPLTVGITAVRGHGEVGHRATGLGVPDLRILPQPPDQHRFVQAHIPLQTKGTSSTEFTDYTDFC